MNICANLEDLLLEQVVVDSRLFRRAIERRARSEDATQREGEPKCLVFLSASDLEFTDNPVTTDGEELGTWSSTVMDEEHGREGFL